MPVVTLDIKKTFIIMQEQSETFLSSFEHDEIHFTSSQSLAKPFKSEDEAESIIKRLKLKNCHIVKHNIIIQKNALTGETL